MHVVTAVLAFAVAALYLVIAVDVVPRLARVATDPGPVLRTARWGAAAFFLGCAVTHVGIGVGMLRDHEHTGTGRLLLVHVLPHLAQVAGGLTFIVIAQRRLDIRLAPKLVAERLDRRVRRGGLAADVSSTLAGVGLDASAVLAAVTRSVEQELGGTCAAVLPGDAGPPAALQAIHPGRVQRHGGDTRIAAPMRAGDGVVGALTAGRATPYDEDDAAFLQDLADRAGMALANAALHGEVLAGAVSLQRALLPYAVAAPEGVEVAGRYRAAGDHGEVGGDWYDTVALPGGGVALVVGDVEGHDLVAASVMGLVRGAVRAYALEGHPPSVVLERVNDFVFSAGIERLVTLGYAELYTDGRTLTIALAGHPAPLVVPTDGPAAVLDVAPGLPLGVAPGQQWPERTCLLPRGALVVLYTDGLVDRPTSPGDPVAHLLEVAGGARPATAVGVADALLAGAPTSDDVAVLVVRTTTERAPVAQRSLPPQRISAGIARIWVADLLELWTTSGLLPPVAVGSDATEVVQLLLTELVSNAVRHSDGPVGLRAQLLGPCLRIDVSDNSHRMPLLRRPGLGETSGRGLVLVDTLATTWGVDLTEHGKSVWFACDLTAAPAPVGGLDGIDEAALLAAFSDE